MILSLITIESLSFWYSHTTIEFVLFEPPFYMMISSCPSIGSPPITSGADPKAYQQSCHYNKGVRIVHMSTKAQELEVGVSLRQPSSWPFFLYRRPLSHPRIYYTIDEAIIQRFRRDTMMVVSPTFSSSSSVDADVELYWMRNRRQSDATLAQMSHLFYFSPLVLTYIPHCFTSSSFSSLMFRLISIRLTTTTIIYDVTIIITIKIILLPIVCMSFMHVMSRSIFSIDKADDIRRKWG